VLLEHRPRSVLTFPDTLWLAYNHLPLWSQSVLEVGNQHSISFDFANLNAPIAGVAGGLAVVFVDEPLNGKAPFMSPAATSLSDSPFRQDPEGYLKLRFYQPDIQLPARSPNLNAFAERWVRSVKQECLSKLILFGEASLRRALGEFVDHFHAERNHQGKTNALLFPSNDERLGRRRRSVFCRERLGGLLKYYCRAA
jgi:Integrase core domain